METVIVLAHFAYVDIHSQANIVIMSYQSIQPDSGSDPWSGHIHQHDCSHSVLYSQDHRCHPKEDQQEHITCSNYLVLREKPFILIGPFLLKHLHVL